MADFKVMKSEFEEALNTGAKARESFSMAVVRTAAVNKKFQFSALGGWAIAEAVTAGGLEVDLRTMEAALDAMVKNYDDAGQEISGTLTTSRDAVFTSVGGSAANPDQVALAAGTSAATATQTARDDNTTVRDKADAIKDACGKLDDGGSIVSALDSLTSDCTTCDTTLTDLDTALATFRGDVDSFEGTYAGLLASDKFITPTMEQQARDDTAANVGAGNWAQISKNVLKVGKNYLSLAGEIFKGDKLFDWAVKNGGKGWRETFAKKLSEGTWGISKLNIKDQLKANWNDFKGMKGLAGRAVTDLKAIKALKKTAAPDNIHAKCAEAIRKSKAVPHTKFGSGLKAAGRFLGYACDVIDVADTLGDAVTAFNDTQGGFGAKVGAAAGQVAKGIAKIGAGKAIGAAVGACFGGPVGAVVGMAAGAVLGTVADAAIDGLFGLFGVKTY